MSSQHKRTTVK